MQLRIACRMPGLWAIDPTNRSFALPLLLVLLFVIPAGCDIPERPPLRPTKLSSSSETLRRGGNSADGAESGWANSADEHDAIEPPIDAFTDDWETWDLYFIGDRQVGYNHVLAQATKENLNSADVRYRVDNGVYVNQGNARTLQRLIQTSLETRDGRTSGFESQLHVGPVVTRYQGEVNGDQMEIEIVRGSTQSTKSIPWSPGNRGLVAIEQTLRTKPMTQKNETRILKLLLPGQYVVATARLRCDGKASVPMMDQSLAELFEINYEVQIKDQPPSYSTIWTDGSGAIFRTFTPGINLVSYRTDEATAVGATKNRNEVVAIVASGEFQRPADAVRVAWTIMPSESARKKGSPIEIGASPGQWVRDMGDGSYQVLVSRKSEMVGEAFDASDLQPEPTDSTPTHFVDSNHPLVRRLVGATTSAGERTPLELALELTRTAHSVIAPAEMPGGLVRASDVARDATGDSTGQAILLASFLRACDIPSRVAIGLKYVPESPARMVYHMWTLAYVDGQWIHLDATIGDQAPADRLTLATTGLATGNEYDAFVAFLNAIARIQIRILRVQY